TVLRVTNVLYGAEASSPDWTKRTAGAMMALDDHELEHEIHDKEQRLFKTGLCTALGYVKDGGFRKAKTLPPHFAPVRRAGPEDYEFLRQFMGDIEVGYLRSGEEVVPFPVGIDGTKSFPYHVGIFATTGMGKSNLMKTLAGSCLATGRYGLLLIDPHDEYYTGGSGKKGLMHHPLATRNLVVYSHRKLNAGLYHKLTLSAHEVDTADLKQLYEFTGAQAEFLDAARRRYDKAWLAEVNDKEVGQILSEVHGFQEGTVGVVKRRITRLFHTGLLHRDPKVSASTSIIDALRQGKVVLISTGGLEDREELLVSTVLARAVLEANKAAFGEEGFDRLPPILIVQEEAQRVLGKGGGKANIFAQIAREGRKFKTGLCAITQQPKLLDTEVISQFNTLFILGLADKRDRDILQDSAKQDVSQLENEIQMLMPGEALITSPYAPFAIPAAIHLYEEYIERVSRTVAVKASSRVVVKDDFY
ncbi:MAG TPA: ATP-binding protein, partial [Candidatus Thermoplasmatota archaeon]|nr:ATP-binding protein [Candidatus Thermoplasmatota archaeon]